MTQVTLQGSLHFEFTFYIAFFKICLTGTKNAIEYVKKLLKMKKMISRDQPTIVPILPSQPFNQIYEGKWSYQCFKNIV